MYVSDAALGIEENKSVRGKRIERRGEEWYSASRNDDELKKQKINLYIRHGAALLDVKANIWLLLATCVHLRNARLIRVVASGKAASHLSSAA